MSYQLATGGGGRPRRDHGRARAQTPAPARCVAFGRRSLQHAATGRQPRHRCRLRHHPPRAPVAAGHRRDRPRVAPRRAAAVRRSPRYMLDIWAFRTFTVQPGETVARRTNRRRTRPSRPSRHRGSNNASADCSSSEPPARHGPRPHPDTASARTNPPGPAVRDYESRS